MVLVAQIAGYTVLLVVSTMLGFMGNPVEMGLAIVAGAIALAFSDLDKFSRIKGAGFEAELREKVEAVIEKETEPLDYDKERKPVRDISSIDAGTRSVVSALHHPKYTWRYLGGIKKDTGLSSEEVRRALDWLVENGYAQRTLGSKGTVWNLTDEGRYLSAVIDFS